MHKNFFFLTLSGLLSLTFFSQAMDHVDWTEFDGRNTFNASENNTIDGYKITETEARIDSWARIGVTIGLNVKGEGTYTNFEASCTTRPDENGKLCCYYCELSNPAVYNVVAITQRLMNLAKSGETRRYIQGEQATDLMNKMFTIMETKNPNIREEAMQAYQARKDEDQRNLFRPAK